MVEYDAPELLDMLKEIVIERKKYCYVCLRTEDERRLVTPTSLKTFLLAMKNRHFTDVHFVCHICERQAGNALKIFRAAAFATTMSLILNELTRRDVGDGDVMLEKKFYNRVLRKTHLHESLTPHTVNEEMKTIRKFGLLAETDTLVMDNKQVYESSPVLLDLTSKQADLRNTQVFQDAIIECPIAPVPDRSETPPSILPDSGNGQNTLSESYIILDEDDDPLKHTEARYAQLTKSSIIQTQTPNPGSNSVLTTNPPQLVSFQDLVQQPKTDDTNILLHPIFLEKNGRLSVPSLSAVIIGGNLVVYEGGCVKKMLALGLNMDAIIQNLMSNKEVFIQNVDLQNAPALTDSSSCQTMSRQSKKMRVDGSILNSSLVNNNVPSPTIVNTQSSNKSNNNNNRTVKYITISDISSDMDNDSPRGSKNKGS